MRGRLHARACGRAWRRLRLPRLRARSSSTRRGTSPPWGRTHVGYIHETVTTETDGTRRHRRGRRTPDPARGRPGAPGSEGTVVGDPGRRSGRVPRPEAALGRGDRARRVGPGRRPRRAEGGARRCGRQHDRVRGGRSVPPSRGGPPRRARLRAGRRVRVRLLRHRLREDRAGRGHGGRPREPDGVSARRKRSRGSSFAPTSSPASTRSSGVTPTAGSGGARCRSPGSPRSARLGRSRSGRRRGPSTSWRGRRSRRTSGSKRRATSTARSTRCGSTGGTPPRSSRRTRGRRSREGPPAASFSRCGASSRSPVRPRRPRSRPRDGAVPRGQLPHADVVSDPHRGRREVRADVRRRHLVGSTDRSGSS